MATQQQLDEARAALHQLQIGKQVVRIQKEGRQVEYTPTKISALREYVKELEIALGVGAQRRPIGVR